MSISDELFDQMNQNIFDLLGETVTFIPLIGDSVEVEALIYSSLHAQPSGLGSETWGMITTIEFMVDDLPDNSPIVGGTVIFGDTEFTIAAVTSNDGRVVKTIVT